ncbi:cell division protein FtsA [Ameyamaea chiangmaiensis NBRC 103196]|uniref:Cell division protein FtsA n=1 Tax=Ameyamaea chiangmaiensis TaxID=442969 RepID=A0A850PL27_9PROT|nr:cell division protein FtsA [Ameyamaea chiangmaiensis]MBS4074370.1 cell division protein FtsA [Ameyamaea chiangmaiensis]NVN42031.1 cell division protein FtsA [Ameyamaea chiangmaiensis]GBQ71814.1 cell division protein FtsA [Ameyamaea chiangmaiensis NBRC 103196]
MNDLIPVPPEKTPASGRRRRTRRGSRDVALTTDTRAQHHVLALPPPRSQPPHHAWRQGVFGVLDIGSTKITCLIGRGEPDGTIKVLGKGWQRSEGVRGGAITDIRRAEAAIRAAVGEAEEQAERSLTDVVVNLSSGSPESRLFNVRWPVGGREVTDADVRRIVTEGQLRARSEGRSVIHTLPLAYAVDDTTGVVDPRGHVCDQLTGRLHVIDAATGTLATLEALLARAELKIRALVSAPLASGLAVLDREERDLGATVVDMGGDTTTLGIFGEGQLIHTAQIGVGGRHITRDLARILSTSEETAERLKTMYGSANFSDDDGEDALPIELIGESAAPLSRVSRSRVISIIHPRIEETLELVRDRLDASGFGKAATGGVVLTGGGSLLEGVGLLAASILDRPIRMGYPTGFRDLPQDAPASAGFATTAGLLSWAAGSDRSFNDVDVSEPGASGLLGRIVNFLRDRV